MIINYCVYVPVSVTARPQVIKITQLRVYFPLINWEQGLKLVKMVKRWMKVVVVAHKGQNWLERNPKSASSWRLLVGWPSAVPAREEGEEGCVVVAACRGEQKHAARCWWWSQWRGCWLFKLREGSERRGKRERRRRRRMTARF